jgi:uracil-DNA glycosylase
VDKGRYVVPDVEVDPERVELVMISEAAPADLGDYYYADGDPFFQRTTVQAFKDAGADVETMRDLMGMGVYLTTAVKCGKTGYSVSAAAVKECSGILEEELALFPRTKVLMLMGDVAIKALNYISKRSLGRNVIPAGSTYKIRKGEYFYGDRRVFPSYLQAGPAFFIERSKRRMIAEDIRNALKIFDKKNSLTNGTGPD